MTPQEREALAHDPNFQLTVKQCTLKAANDLLADPEQPTYVTQYAQTIVTDPNGGVWLLSMSYGVLTNPAIDQNYTESDIQFTVNSIFEKYAKAFYRIVDVV